MKRSGVLLAPAILAFAIAGCDSGIQEGMATGPLPPAGQTADFQNEMKKNAGNMVMKKPARKNTPPGAAAPATTPAPTPETKDAP